MASAMQCARPWYLLNEGCAEIFLVVMVETDWDA
jgi:hypothetical protein